MDLKLMWRFLPYALTAVITITSSLWFRRSRRSRGNPERSINSEEGEAEATPPPSSPPPFVREDIGFKYDVFLSFRGPDTRKGFTGHLYEALKGKGIDTFIDNEKLEKGQKVEKLFECIERSKIFVPIFSKGYADSEWCLREMAKMVQCQRLIVPVFFDVEPRDVRHQTTGPFAPAFTRHHQNKKIDKEEVSQWSDALRKGGELSGYTLADTEGNEAKLIGLIVKKILNEVNKTSLLVANHPVGLGSRIADVLEMLDVDDNNVRMVGIHGMGGIGKTTLAKAVYNQIYTRFDASSFIANVREAEKQSTGLASLQEKLLRDFFNDENVKVDNIDEGIEIIKNRIRSKKVLMVLDDVDRNSQLDALAGSPDWFCSGSRIIITTRDKHALGAKIVNLYEPEELDGPQSLQLFSWHAFGKKDPDPKFAELSKDVASAGAGLPLALIIFGSLFFDLKTEEEWREMLQKLQEDQDKDIHVRLKISFDVLEEKEKKVFLDIACFFLEEENIELPLLMWEACKFFPNTTIKVLRHKSLININDDTGRFEMHDLIRDMGRKITQDSRSRLWKDDETLDVLQTKKGTENIEAIQLNSGTYREPTRVEAKSFVVMSELRMLRLGEYVRLKGEFEHFPKKLRWLQWNIRHFSSLPNGLHLETIVVLDLSNSWITQLWNPQGLESTKVFGKMKVLKLNGCWMLTSCPDFKRMPHLEKLNLNGCKRMSELDPSIGLLESLTHLTLSNCASLKELNPEKWQLTSLEKLDLNGCDEITTLPSQLGNSKSLACLSLCNCKSLMELPDVSSLKGLRQLDLRDCKGIVNVLGVQDLDKLEELDLSGCQDLIRCPLFSSNMTHLWRLDFEDCAKLTELDPSIAHLKSLTVLILSNCESVKELPKEVSQLTSLERLDLTGCYQISALPESMSHLKQLKWLSLEECSSLTEISDCICSFLNLEELDLSWTAIEEMPHSIVSLENLEWLSVSHCYRLKLLPWLPPSLTELRAEGCGKLEDVPGIKQMKLLQVLDLGGCRSLHDSFLERLEEANFQNLEEFCIPGRRLLSYPQSLSFLLPKQFETGILYLHVDKSSLDNICSELDEWEDGSLESEEDRNMDSNDSELAYKSIPSDEVKDSRQRRVVLIEITTGDAKFQFSALIEIQEYETSSEEEEFRKLPTATFGEDSELMKMAMQGEFEGNDDARQRTMMIMRVSIDGCVLLHGDLFTYTKPSIDWIYPDPIEADDNLVIVEFDWQSYLMFT